MNISEVHAELTQRLKDLEFFDLERRFFKKIVKDYVSGSGLISQRIVTDFKERLDQLGADVHSMRSEMIKVLTKVELIIKNIMDEDADDLQHEQMVFRNRYKLLFDNFLKFKAELYQLTSQIIEEETID